MRCRLQTTFVFCAVIVVATLTRAETIRSSVVRSVRHLSPAEQALFSIDGVTSIRGGAALKQKAPSPIKSMREQIAKIKPLTRAYMVLALLLTTIHITGVVDAPKLFMLDARKSLQLWRMFTAASFLGPLNMSMASNLYFFIQYGQKLEGDHGTAEYAVFLAVQVLLLSIVGWGMGLPFTAQSMVAANLHCCARLEPYLITQWIFGIQVEYWKLPFGLMIVDCLQAQSPMPAIPHIVGILTGHVYHFYHTVWPKLGGRQWICAPKFLKRILGDRPKSNISGTDFRQKASSDAGARSA